ncbi:hypothetical protein PENTCL1PPCAC_19802, partial [Pristionchus entomophagus]
CAHGTPCIQGNFSAAFEGLHLSDLDRRGSARQRQQSEGAETAYTRSVTARSHSSRTDSTSIYENDSYASGKRHGNKRGAAAATREEKSVVSGGGKTGSRGGAAVKVYIGIKTADEAERIVTRATDFKMYHRLSGGRDLDALHAHLPLYIVYRTTKNAARHIPIKTVVQNKRRFLSAGMNAENKRLLFESIDALVKYYKTYVQLQPEGQPGMVDVFPA